MKCQADTIHFSVVSKSRRDSVGGGGSSGIFPWSPKADAIQWGGGGVVADKKNAVQGSTVN